MNYYQKLIIAAGGILAALRAFFPVRYTQVFGMRFKPSSDTNLFQNVDWSATGLQIGGIVIVTAALVLIFKKK